jgi:hypothetical protein
VITTVDHRRDPRDHDGGHPETAQDDLQIGAVEGTEAVLHDHDLLVARGDCWEDRDTTGAVHQGLTPGDPLVVHQEPEITAARAVDMRRIDDGDAALAATGECALEVRHHRPASTRLQGCVRGNEVVLHVDHDEGRLAGVDLFYGVHLARSFAIEPLMLVLMGEHLSAAGPVPQLG